MSDERRWRANAEVGHHPYCRCEECDRAAEAWSVADVYEAVGCERARYVADDEINQLIDIYFNLIRPGHIDLWSQSCRYLDIARIAQSIVPEI